MRDHRWWCKHYNGIPSVRCKLGITYESVKVMGSRHIEYPCYEREVTGVCLAREYLTDEEYAEQEKHTAIVLKKFTDYLNGETNVCPHCGIEVIEEYQVGRCAYARPCGCRVFQGKARGVLPNDH